MIDVMPEQRAVDLDEVVDKQLIAWLAGRARPGGL